MASVSIHMNAVCCIEAAKLMESDASSTTLNFAAVFTLMANICAHV
jgi:hypothetical protein